MILLSDNDRAVRVECNACGAHQTLRRFRNRRMREEPEQGQWLRCTTCGDWSPLETRPPVNA